MHQFGEQTIILKNEQPIPGCKECAIIWFNLVNYRSQWNKRPSEFRLQELFEGAQDAFLDHYRTHQTAEEV